MYARLPGQGRARHYQLEVSLLMEMRRLYDGLMTAVMTLLICV